MIYPITPVPKPRQTQSDKWKKRPRVMQYRAFADDVRKLRVRVPEAGSRVIFTLPMPKSWSKAKRENMRGRPHRQTPDIDNLCKALLDALYADDSVVWDIAIRKVWGDQGAIEIETTS